jgi:hypothetical protein
MDEVTMRRVARKLGEARRLIDEVAETGLNDKGRVCECCTLYVRENVHEARLKRSTESLGRKVSALYREFEKVYSGEAGSHEEEEEVVQ